MSNIKRSELHLHTKLSDDISVIGVKEIFEKAEELGLGAVAFANLDNVQDFPDKIIVTGHTPTGFIDPKFKGKIWHKNNHIAIDCGAVFGNPLGCICLDTLEEFYVEEKYNE